MTRLVLSTIGDDRPGLVAALAAAVASNGGNWLDSEMAHLGGKFAGIVLIDVPVDRIDGLRDAARSLTEQGLLEVRLTAADPQPGPGDVAPSGILLSLHLLGQDRPGIVQDVAVALADAGVSIEELTTTSSPAPMSDGLLFRADGLVRLPEGGSVDAARAALESLANELMVDLDIAPSSA